MCTGLCTVTVSVAFSGHINVMVLSGAESGVLRIQTSGDISVGGLHPKFFNEHCKVISTGPLAYRAVTHDDGFAKGWKDVVILQN